MKKITIDFDTYEAELTEAQLRGANLSKILLGEIESYIQNEEKALTYNQRYAEKLKVLKIIRDLHFYHNKEKKK